MVNGCRQTRLAQQACTRQVAGVRSSEPVARWLASGQLMEAANVCFADATT
jgi:hypothetical protein